MVSVSSFPVVDAGVQCDAQDGDLLWRQIIVALLVAIDYHSHVTGVAFQKVDQLADSHCLSWPPNPSAYRFLAIAALSLAPSTWCAISSATNRFIFAPNRSKSSGWGSAVT